MNRSILIVICDFLLVTLLVFSTPDINKKDEKDTQKTAQTNLATNQLDSGKDLAAVMRLALEEEQKNRERLLSELTTTRGTLSERESQVQTFQQKLQAKQAETSQLQERQTNLQQQFAAAQTNIQTLKEQLHDTSSEALISKEKLAAMEAEMRRQSEQLALLARSNQFVLDEKQKLSSQLQVAEAEKRSAREIAAVMQEQVKAERAEKARLAVGVQELATNSSKLAQEIRDNRPLTPNAIFNEFLANRVNAQFSATRMGFFGGDATKRKDAETVLVADGTNIFAVCHVEDTPLALWSPGTDWLSLSSTLWHGTVRVPVYSISFHLRDPRLVFMPVGRAEVEQLGSKVYRTSSEPFKFQDAVIVGTTENYYGECKFEIDPTTPGYVKLDRSFLKGLFGKFNPSRGDLVFSKNDELLGVMANNTYCMVATGFDAAATFQLGWDMRDQHTAKTLSQLQATLLQLPFKLQ